MNFYKFSADGKRHLDRTGLLRRELAERAGIAQEPLSRLTAGHNRASGPRAWRMARAWADALGVNEEEAFTMLFQPAPMSPRAEFEYVPQRIPA